MVTAERKVCTAWMIVVVVLCRLRPHHGASLNFQMASPSQPSGNIVPSQPEGGFQWPADAFERSTSPFFSDDFSFSHTEKGLVPAAELAHTDNTPLSLQEDHERKMEYLIGVLGIAPMSVDTILAACPQILRQSLSQDIYPFVDYLCETLQVERVFIGRMLTSYPLFFQRSVQANARSVIDFLTQVGLSTQQLKKVLRARPTLLALRVDRNLQPTVRRGRPPACCDPMPPHAQ